MPGFTPYMQRYLEQVLQAIEKGIYIQVGELAITAFRTPEPVSWEERLSGQAMHLQVGQAWGELFDCAWFCFRGQVPASAAGQPVVLLLDVNGEMLVVDQAGAPLRGLTNVASTFDLSLGWPGKRVLPLTHCALGGENIEVWADAGANDLFGNLQENGTIRQAAIAILHEEARNLYYDFEILLDSLKVLPETSARYAQILVALSDVSQLLRSDFTPKIIQQARLRMAPVLAKHGGDPSLEISAIGHAHIDLGWLWPVRETRRKGARTFATALANLEAYPGTLFAASQAQLFQWMKEDYPALYARIRQAVQERRLEPQGALWVECDTNVTGGEALVRQILYGRSYFQNEFDIDVNYVWLPDTFGYSAALPGILKGAGIPYFSTQKLSWSLINAFPHHSFHWQGLDGSRVLVHMLPEETYNSPAAPRSLGKIEANYREKDISSHALLIYGIGDGGGGPGEEHLERLRRLENFAGLPPVRNEWTAEFFERWAEDADRFPVWAGELYLERHQGTLTTQAANKRWNRRVEGALREWELFAGLAEITAGEPYPARRMGEVWREVLLYQFHDILPGSSIKRVYDETAIRYSFLHTEVETAIESALTALARRIETGAVEKPYIVFNSLSWDREAWLHLGAGWQQVHVPAMGWFLADAARSTGYTGGRLVAEDQRLENERLIARFDESGALVSLYDKLSGREAISANAQANRLAVYPDLGDAWDFPMDYAECEPKFMEIVSCEARVDGPQAVLVQEYRLGHSRLTQTICLEAGSPLLEFRTQATWRETKAMLRVSFPVDILAENATYEIQFGHLHRPTHRNTTWDLARDEVAAHYWADLSQGDYGVALLNDSKYGHKIKGNVIDLNLIRSVPYPGPSLVKDEDVPPGEAHAGYTDQCEHAFRYALYPHPGGPMEAGVVRAGKEFNFPLRCVEASAHGGEARGSQSWLRVEPATVVADTLKKAEDNDGWIVRLYESAGGAAHARLSFTLPIQQVYEANLLELPAGEPLALQDGLVNLAFRPFEIKTLRISIEKEPPSER